MSFHEVCDESKQAFEVERLGSAEEKIAPKCHPRESIASVG